MLGAIPPFQQCAGAQGETIVSVLRRAGLFRRHAARRQHEAPLIRDTARRTGPHRHETKRRQACGLAGQNGGVILAAAVGANTGVSLQGSEAGAVFDARVVARGVDGRADVCGPLISTLQCANSNQHGGDADHQRARAAHSGRARQVAREHDVGAQRGVLKISREPPDDDTDVVPPAGKRFVERRPERHGLAVARVDDIDDPVVTFPRGDRETAGNRGDQGPAARVVRVLAEHFESPRHPPGANRRRHGLLEGRMLPEDLLEQSHLAVVLGGLQPALDQRVGQRCACHGRGDAVSRRRARSIMSARRDRSRTGPHALRALKRTPRVIASVTASGSSNSPRGDRATSRHGPKMRESKRQQFMLTRRSFRLKAEATGMLEDERPLPSRFSWLPPSGGRSASRGFATRRTAASWLPPSGGRSPSRGFSTILLRYPSSSVSTNANARTRSAGMFPVRTRSAASNTGKPGSSSDARSDRARTGYRLSAFNTRNGSPAVHCSAASTAFAVPSGASCTTKLMARRDGAWSSKWRRMTP